MKTNMPLKATIACLTSMCLILPDTNSQDSSSAKKNSIQGELTIEKRNNSLTYLLPSMASLENWICYGYIGS